MMMTPSLCDVLPFLSFPAINIKFSIFISEDLFSRDLFSFLCVYFLCYIKGFFPYLNLTKSTFQNGQDIYLTTPVLPGRVA